MNQAFRRPTCCHCLLTFRMNTDTSTDPDLEPAPLAAEFCPRTS